MAEKMPERETFADWFQKRTAILMLGIDVPAVAVAAIDYFAHNYSLTTTGEVALTVALAATAFCTITMFMTRRGWIGPME